MDLSLLQRVERLWSRLSGQRAGHGAGGRGGDGRLHWGQVRLIIILCFSLVDNIKVNGFGSDSFKCLTSIYLSFLVAGSPELCACELPRRTRPGQRISRLSLFSSCSSPSCPFFFFWFDLILWILLNHPKPFSHIIPLVHVWRLLFCWQWTVNREAADILLRTPRWL